jgi:hypothetical protein
MALRQVRDFHSALFAARHNDLLKRDLTGQISKREDSTMFISALY